MSDLAEFLLARIAEDKAAAINAPSGRISMNGFVVSDSRRLLAECEAKRRIVELHDHDDKECFEMHRGVVGPGWPKGAHGRQDGDPWAHSMLEAQEGPCPTLRLLGLPYADHQDYREEWRP